MASDIFAERLARIRTRFTETLEGKIADTYAAVLKLSLDEGAVEETYRRIHAISGIGETVGYAATGNAAERLEKVILAPYRARRRLTPIEIESFKTALDALRETARRELKSNS